MQRWILILTITMVILAGCSPEPPPVVTPTSTVTPPGLSQQLNQFATQTQAAVQTTTAEVQQSPQGPLPAHTPLPVTPLPAEAFGPFQQFSPQEALTAGNPMDLQVGENGIVVLSENGISGLKDGEWLGYFTGEIGYPVGIDITGRAWVAGPDGTAIQRSEPYIWQVAQYDDTIIWEVFDWTPAGSESGKPVKFGLLTDSRGDLWLATVNDVRSFNGAWNVHDSLAMGMPKPAGGSSADYVILPLRSTGEVLVGRCDWGSAGPQGGGGVRSFDGQAWRELAAELNSGCVTAIAEDSAGDLWLALDDSLYHFNRAGETWEEINIPAAPPQASYRYITGLTADPVDGLWVQLALCEAQGCFGGEMLYRFGDGEWQPIGEPSLAGGRRVLFDSSEAPWLLAAGELSQIIANTFEPISGLSVLAATNDESGKLWLLAQSTGAPTIWTDR